MLLGLVQLSNQVYADALVETVTASTDVKATMKKMSFIYKEAMEINEPEVMQDTISNLQQLVASVQLVEFDPERHQVLQQGLIEVQAQLELAQAKLSTGNIIAAKQQLKNIIALKKQYHKERSPSLWQLIFG